MQISPVRFLVKLIRWCWRSLWLLLFLTTFAFLIASHTVTSLAFLTSAAISAVSGTGSVISNERAKRTELDAELGRRVDANRQLSVDIENERQLSTALRGQLNQDELKTRQVQILSRRVVEERSQAALLRGELATNQTRINDLSSENRRLQQAQSVVFRGQNTPIRQAVEQTISSANARIAKTATTNVASMPAESIPIYGIGIVVAATAFEIDMACRTMDDFYALQIALEPDLAVPVGRNEVCGLGVPTKEEIWQLVKDSPSAAWEGSVAGLEAASANIKSLRVPDFGMIWRRVVLSFDHWF